jgi:L-threonate 2-dehydrogenase
MNAPRVLVVGVGQMGGGMAQRCINAGFDVRVIDVDVSKLAEFEAERLSVHEFPRSIATFSVVIVCVVDDVQVRDVLFSQPDAGLHFHHGLARRLAAGSTVLVTSTISVSAMQSIGADLDVLGLQMVDAPVSGGPVRARDGSMSMMLAGSAPALAAAQPVLNALSNAQSVLGSEIGAATTAKLLNNALAAAHLHNHAQALNAATQLSLQASLLQGVVDASSGQSWIGTHRARRFLGGQREVQARMALLAKDSALAMDMLHSSGLSTEWLAPAAKAFADACAAGWQTRDDSELIRWLAENPHADSS